MRQRDPYVTRKNIVIISATALTLPTETKMIAIISVTRVALTGSPSLLLPDASHLFSLMDGREASLARACRVRGPTMTEPSAEEMVDAASPSGTINTPPIAIL